MKSLFALAVIIFPAAAGCQNQNLPALNVLLDRLDTYARQYQATLPSLSCDEQITSQALNRKGKISRQVKIHSTLREVRTEDPYDPFLEKREVKSVNGHRDTSTSQSPYFVEGGFASLVGFKTWEQRDCFDFALTSEGQRTVRLEMKLKPKVPNPTCAKLPPGFQRIVIADPGTGQIVHTERTIAPEVTSQSSAVYFGGIDYAPQKLGEQTFWLPSRFYAHNAQNTGRMFVTYSNCHRYIGDLKILPGPSITEAGPKP